MNNFPFKDNPDTAVFTCSHVLEENMPILYVSHDEDGFWQFLCGMNHTESDARIVSIYEIYQTDNSVKEISYLTVIKLQNEKIKTVSGLFVKFNFM